MKRIVMTMLALAVSIGLSQLASAEDAPKKGFFTDFSGSLNLASRSVFHNRREF